MKNEKGQTAVEYVLLMVVIVAIMTGMFRQLKEYMVTGPNSIQAQFQGVFQSNLNGYNARVDGKYKYFTIRR